MPIAADITPRLAPGTPIVQGYGGGGFRVAGARYEGAILIVGERVTAWPAAALPDTVSPSLEPVFAASPPVELVLFGCGARTAPLPGALRAALARRGAAAESMSTGAACRTFNVLAAEGRRIAAALLPVA